jgi:hypothetical protein
VLSEPSPPILLPLATESRKPATKRDLLQEAQKDGKPDHLKPPIIELRPQSMDCATVGTTVPLDQQCLRKVVKIPPHIPMTPQSWASASWAPPRTGPRIVLVPAAQFLQKLDIEITMQYQVGSLWGITEDTTPAKECTLGYPFSFPSTYSEKKKDLYNKR